VMGLLLMSLWVMGLLLMGESVFSAPPLYNIYPSRGGLEK
jgi:hypothetical protein